MVEPVGHEVWLLLGNRLGEVSQQRAVAAALGLPVREIPVAWIAPDGREVRFDFDALRPPWPRVAISFGKTLEAARCLRERAGKGTLLVHLGLPRRMAVDRLGLVVPMPADQYVEAGNVLRVRMPLNPARSFDPASAMGLRLQSQTWPRPWLALLIGGPSRRLALRAGDIERVARAANARARSHGGSVLAITSPRTPEEASPILRRELRVPGEVTVYVPGAEAENPLAAYLHFADEAVVTGDSASMIAEAWRSGRPLFVAPVRESVLGRARHALRRMVPDALIASGRVSGDVDIGRWIGSLAREGIVGLLGSSAPAKPYSAAADDEVLDVARRIVALLPEAS